MDISLFEYELNENQIANSPMEPRDQAKLMVIDRKSGNISHKHIFDLPNILRESDVLVVNNTKVFPARLIGKKSTGGKIEVLLNNSLEDNRWRAIHKGKINKGDKVYFDDNSYLEVLEKDGNGIIVSFPKIANFSEWIYKNGKTPLPPYINSTEPETMVREKYQTTYAKSEGSIAAPTAGLHFTERLLEEIKSKGIEICEITLHVGLGTFLPVTVSDIKDHKMHSERYEVELDTLRDLNRYKSEGRRIIAVGTTSLRTLETISDQSGQLIEEKRSSDTEIFIYPPYKFKFVDCLITNFHLPHSTLLALVSAFVSKPNTDSQFTSFKESLMGKAYKIANEENYRFFSFGDASMIQ
jgi:S-adenosylmethionine:tRNA ribosyltransferase-isomerase